MTLPWVTQLLDAGLITAAQFRASQAERSDVRSAEVVRNLIDQGLDERTLAGFFVSLGFGPMLQARELARADAGLIERLPAALAHRCCALPLQPTAAGAVVAMADPTDEASVREISDALGERVLPTAARLSDLLDALSLRYPNAEVPVAVPVRHPSGVVPLVQAEPGIVASSPSDASPGRMARPTFAGTGSAVWDRAWDRSIRTHSDSKQTVLDADAVRARHTPAPVPPTDLDLGPLERALNRDDLVRAACQAGLPFARGVGFVTLRKGVFRGWGGAGEHLTEAGIRSLWVPSSNPSLLSDVVHGGSGWRGPYPQTAADQLLRAALGAQGREVLIAPVRVGERILGLLCADDPRSHSESIDEIAVAMGRRFERLIVAQKVDR